MLKRFFQNHKTLNFFLQKKIYDAEIFYGPQHLNCGRKIDKINKNKYKGKKSHAEDRTRDGKR
jgi:hypothetical protein